MLATGYLRCLNGGISVATHLQQVLSRAIL